MTSERFIHDVLSNSGKRMVARQGQEIRAKLTQQSGNLVSSRRITVSTNVMSFIHPVYERFLDMKIIRGEKKRRRTKIHNRFVYGTYASIAEQLMYGFVRDWNEENQEK